MRLMTLEVPVIETGPSGAIDGVSVIDRWQVPQISRACGVFVQNRCDRYTMPGADLRAAVSVAVLPNFPAIGAPGLCDSSIERVEQCCLFCIMDHAPFSASLHACTVASRRGGQVSY